MSKVLTRKSRLALEQAPLKSDDESTSSARSNVLRSRSIRENDTELTWNEEFDSFSIDEVVSLLFMMEKKSSRLNSFIKMNKTFEENDIPSFDLRSNGVVEKCSSFICTNFKEFDERERVESMKILNYFATVDKLNIPYIPASSINLCINTIPLCKTICKTFLLAMQPKYKDVSSIVADQRIIAGLVVNDKELRKVIVSLEKGFLKFFPINAIKEMINEDPTLLVDATMYSEEARNDAEIMQMSTIESIKGNSDIGTSAICNILSKNQAAIKQFCNNEELKMKLRKLSKEPCGTIAAIALSYLESTEEVLDSLQCCLALERSREIRQLIKGRIDAITV